MSKPCTTNAHSGWHWCARFDPPLMARMTANMHRYSPTLSYAPHFWYSCPFGEFIWDRWPDMMHALDGILYPFRNQKQGAGPCARASCPWPKPPPHPRSCCLAGACAESTASNLAGEISDVLSALPDGRTGALVAKFFSEWHPPLPPARDADSAGHPRWPVCCLAAPLTPCCVSRSVGALIVWLPNPSLHR
jgi:hypothetical protein